MRKSILTIACVCAGFMFTGCGSDDGDDNATPQNFIIDARNIENGSDYNSHIDSVKAIRNYHENNGAVLYNILASAEYVDGGFMMTLPLLILDDKWTPISNNVIPDGVNVSDPHVKTTSVDYLATFKNGQATGKFEYICKTADNHDICASYIYVDRDITITGSSDKEEDNWTVINIFDNIVELKKGWNEVYVTSIGGINSTTFITSNVKPDRLKWIFKP
ncbi:MAG: hypothetical protein LBP63_10520 [Prevotellaceae bacterium]|jgi:hypothetical protein|nr:hypothetical protein [Prevotellaceae bacterium]